jgi:hypothetical protein
MNSFEFGKMLAGLQSFRRALLGRSYPGIGTFLVLTDFVV